jgi:hypothetical protein
MKSLMERIIEIVQENDGERLLADALVRELIEWGPIAASDGNMFDDCWDDLLGEEA